MTAACFITMSSTGLEGVVEIVSMLVTWYACPAGIVDPKAADRGAEAEYDISSPREQPGSSGRGRREGMLM